MVILLNHFFITKMLDFKTLKRLVKKDISALPLLKVSLLGDSATQLLATAIRGVGVDRGFNVDLYESDFNQIEQQVMDPTSDFYQFDAEISIIFQSIGVRLVLLVVMQ